MNIACNEYKNGNITLKITDNNNNIELDNNLICEIINTLDWIDTYLITDPYCFGNDCIAYDFYNIRLNKVYTINTYIISKYLLAGKTLRLYAASPDNNDMENITRWMEG